jgi:hypothetical protein
MNTFRQSPKVTTAFRVLEMIAAVHAKKPINIRGAGGEA